MDKRENVTLWREKWADSLNREFERKGLPERFSHESYKIQDMECAAERIPTKHLGKNITALERKGIPTERGNENRAITERNKEIEKGKEFLHEKKQELEIG
ncbi:MAG: MobA/MobL family protein [Oscillospiraceae bacterium]|nr:MobA/MobL family protein [Oscillospiraceae bacterium]